MGRKRGSRQTAPDKAEEGRAKGAAKMVATNKDRRVWSQPEVLQQLAAIEQLLSQSATETAVVHTLREQFQVGSWRAKRLIDRVRAKWDQEDRTNRQHWKAEQIRSLKRSIARLEVQISAEETRAAEKQGVARVVGMYNAKARLHELLADITGTRAPLAIDVELKAEVHVQQTVLAVVAGMTGDDLTALMQQAEENERLAEEWRRLQGEVPAPKALPPVTVESRVDGMAE